MEMTFSTAENWVKKGCYTDKKKSQENHFQGLAKPLNSYNVRTCSFSSQQLIRIDNLISHWMLYWYDKKKFSYLTHEESFMYGVSKGVLESKVHLPTSCDPLQ